MEEIRSMAEALGKQIYDSDDYKEYVSFRKKVDENPLLKHKLQDMRQMQFGIELRRKEGQIIPLEEERRLGDLYCEIMLDEDGYGLWRSEGKLLHLIADTLEIITREVPMDLEYDTGA